VIFADYPTKIPFYIHHEITIPAKIKCFNDYIDKWRKKNLSFTPPRTDVNICGHQTLMCNLAISYTTRPGTRNPDIVPLFADFWYRKVYSVATAPWGVVTNPCA
jgi:hypothetical protein